MVKVHILSQCEYCSDHAAPTNSIRDSRGFDILIDGGKTSAGPVVVAYLRAQGVEAYQAACAGTWIHANAGLLAAKQIGNTASVIARDVLNCVAQVMSDF
jgi:hypothetical protein